MTRLILVPLLLAACAFAQVPTTASITGTVKRNGVAAASQPVTLSANEKRIAETKTDAAGSYSFDGVPPGSIGVSVQFDSLTNFYPLQLIAGQKVVANFDYAGPGKISGRITDENKTPLKGVTITLIHAEYVAGAARYFTGSATGANDAGEYVVSAPPRNMYVQSHKAGLMPTYFPGVESIDSAMAVLTPPEGKRELVDIQMRSAPARCIDGRIETPPGEKPALYEIGENDPPLWTANVPMRVNKRAPAGDDGKFKVCDLHPGNYWIKTYSATDAAREHAIEFVTIGDKDVSGIVIGPKPQFPVEVVVSWNNELSADDPPAKLLVGLMSAIGEYGTVNVPIEAKLPARISLPVSNHGYVLSVIGVPANAYLKDITYGGRSILNEVFQPGAAAAADGLRIVFARDSARLSVKAVDKDGNPVVRVQIALIPGGATSEAAAATAMTIGQSDAAGTWTSGPVAPGRYHVIVTTSRVSRDVDTFAKLWRAMSESDVVELTPNGSAQLTRIPAPIE